MSVTKDQIIEAIKGMNIVELNELVKTIEEEFGVSAVASVAVVADSGAGTQEASEVNVTLEDAGASKLAVIKVVRELTGLGLKESKELVDNVPSTIKEAITPEAAEDAKAKLEAAGATVKVG